MRGELQLQDQEVLAEIAARRQQVTSANEKFDKLYKNIAQDGGTRVRLDDKEVYLIYRFSCMISKIAQSVVQVSDES